MSANFATTDLCHTIPLGWEHRVFFTRDVFGAGRGVWESILTGAAGEMPKVMVFVDAGVLSGNEELVGQIEECFSGLKGACRLAGAPVVMPGGEGCKNDWGAVERLWKELNDKGIDRHSYVLVIGGGAFLDLVGFAAATAHRGIRLVRMPTTTLSQGDGGVGVKNGVNRFGKKNWVGTFAVPAAVVNDFSFLRSLPARECRQGLVECVKVALLRDAAFFEKMESEADELAALEAAAVESAIERSAALHVAHIATGGDPFELGSARPLDFGHWVAHKIEPTSGFRIGHGEAVAIGMAVDLIYARELGLLSAADCERILRLLERIGFALYDYELEKRDATGHPLVLRGLEEFREHLGGQLTITLVTGIGSRLEVHEMDEAVVWRAVEELKLRNATTKGKV